MGAQAVNIGPAINMVVAQRLVRRICKKCAIEKIPTQEELKEIKEAIKGIEEIPNSFKILEAKGCKECSFTGYKYTSPIYRHIDPSTILDPHP